MPLIDQIASDTLVVGGGAGALVALAMYLRRIFKGMGLEEARQEGEHAVIKTLRDEVNRLADINGDMSAKLTIMHKEILNLTQQNINLITEISALRSENESLRAEVLKLHEQIERWDNKCASCKFKQIDEDNL